LLFKNISLNVSLQQYITNLFYNTISCSYYHYKSEQRWFVKYNKGTSVYFYFCSIYSRATSN